jgi:hypothetical protein
MAAEVRRSDSLFFPIESKKLDESNLRNKSQPALIEFYSLLHNENLLIMNAKLSLKLHF